MQFYVFSRSEIENENLIDVKHVIISINSTGSKLAKVVRNDATLAVGAFVFDDLDQEPGPAYRQVYGEPVLFTHDHAKAILEFVETYLSKVEVVAVHCDASYSRSPAVAAALAMIYNGDDQQFWGSNQMYGSSRYSPNPLVYRTLLSVWQEKSRG